VFSFLTRGAHEGSIGVREQAAVTQEEVHLLDRLKRLLAITRRGGKAGRLGAPDGSVVQENRRMVRDCIRKLRFVRAGVASAFLGLGQREPRRTS
jgi:hypothetical protein